MTDAPPLTTRHPDVSDHGRVLAAVTDWWPDGRGADIRMLLPRLFFQHFTNSSWVVEDEAGDLRAFLIGFQSADDPEVAYIHFVGVDPRLRGAGLGRTLYERFFADMRAAGCRRVDAITGPVNTTSQAFHRAMGFTLSGDTEIDGVPAYRDYDGPGEHRVAFSRQL
jgi:predicted GNAT superfamily acetyltransferase